MSQARRNTTVGIFVILGLILAGVTIFLIGNERRFFSARKNYKTSFKDVAGLKAGAPVRMGGIDIGQVKEVAYDQKAPTDTTVYVTFDVVDTETARIRTDSRARISTKGLLGDKLVEITRGSDDAESVPPESFIPSDVGSDMMSEVTEVARKAKNVMENVERATEPLSNAELHADIRGSLASLNKILESVSTGDGYVHRLLSDKDEADRFSRTIDNLDKATVQLTGLIQDTRGVVSRVQTGPGFLHDLLYGAGPQPQIEKFGDAAGEIALALRGIRENESLAHDLLYGGKGDTAQAVANINAITGDLRVIVADIRAGKGTIGGLLVDPSIYEDAKAVLGNVQRNDVLRALVRFSIKQDEQKPEVEVAK